MMEAAARQHQPVEMGDGQTDRQPLRLVAQHAAGRGSVPIQPVALSPIARRRHKGLAVDDIGDVTEDVGIEDGIDLGALLRAALGQALDL